MKKSLNILDQKNYSTSKFESMMNKVSVKVLLIGLILFMMIIIRLVFDQVNTPFFNKINPISSFFENHGINPNVIWIDTSPFLCVWLLSVCILTIWGSNNYKRAIRDEYNVKTTSKLISLNQEIDELKAANKFIDEAFRSYRNDVKDELLEKQKRIDYYSEKYDRIRDSKGHYLPKNK